MTRMHHLASICCFPKSEAQQGRPSKTLVDCAKFHTLTQLVSYDYTKGKLPVLVDIIIESGAKLFVSAVGVPPKEVRIHP